MDLLRKIEIGVLVTIISALIGFGFFIGGLSTDVKNVKDEHGDVWKDLRDKAIREVNAAKGSLEICPVGTIVAYAGRAFDVDNLPDAWMLCDGKPVPDGPEYKELRTVLANVHWGKKGEILCLPDLRGLFLRGVDDPDGEEGEATAGRDDDAAERVYGTTKGGVVGSYQEDATSFPRSPFVIRGWGPYQHSVLYEMEKSVDPDDPDKPFAFEAISRAEETKTIGGKDNPIINMPEHGHEIEGGDNETRPKNCYVNWIIRVK